MWYFRAPIKTKFKGKSRKVWIILIEWVLGNPPPLTITFRRLFSSVHTIFSSSVRVIRWSHLEISSHHFPVILYTRNVVCAPHTHIAYISTSCWEYFFEWKNITTSSPSCHQWLRYTLTNPISIYFSLLLQLFRFNLAVFFLFGLEIAFCGSVFFACVLFLVCVFVVCLSIVLSLK